VLVLPARDEAAAIAEVVARVPPTVAGRPVTCIVVDDGSTDATAALARAAGARVVEIPGGRGLGAAVRRGLQEGVGRGAAAVAFCDADGEYAPEELGALVEPILAGDADYVVGSRFDGRIDRMLPHRRFGNRVLTRWVRWMTRLPVNDGQSGYRALSADAARNARIAHDYNYAQVLTLDLVSRGYRYAEVPISYHFRESGRSFVKLVPYLRRVVPAVLGVVGEAHERDRAASHPPRRSPGRRRLVGTVAAAVALAFAALAFASLAARATIPLDGTKPVALSIAVLLAVAGMTALAWPWREVLHTVGAPHLARTRTLAAYFTGEVGKYVPGGIWPVVGRAERARRLGVDATPAYASVVLSLGLAYLAAGVVFALALPAALLSGNDALASAWVLVVVPIGLVALHPRVLGTALRLAERLARRPIGFTPPAWRSSIRLAVSYIPAWLLIGGATALIGLVLAPDAEAAQLFAAAVGSWIVGFLVIPAPGGVGVREIAFAAASGLAFDTGLAIAVTARLCFVAVDLVAFALASRALRRGSVLDDVGGEALAVEAPPITVEAPAA
jgi:hypothetical protein